MSTAERTRLIRVIHVAKNSLQLSDDEYRALLQGASGGQCDSCKSMNLPHLRKAYQALKKRGFEPTRKKGGRSHRKGKATQLSKVWALWFELKRLGVIDRASRASLTAFVKRQTELNDIDQLNAHPQKANQVIEALKAMELRHERTHPNS